ncbi:class I SAM-dependent methyltransferase [bacterium]|nr:class I SAM-dependent methyltransferase [bacterium]
MFSFFELGQDSIDWMEAVRLFEIGSAIEGAGINIKGLSVLEIGSGTGFQLKFLKRHAKCAVGIDIKSSIFRENQIENIIEYDGRNIPFDDSSFDMVFSSNVLEHIRDIDGFLVEMKRVLKDDGLGVHIMPSRSWRLFTSIFYYPWMLLSGIEAIVKMKRGLLIDKKMQQKIMNKFSESEKSGDIIQGKNRNKYSYLRHIMLPHRHGVRGDGVSEFRYFSTKWWIREFKRNGWVIVNVFPTGLFYFGHDFFRFKIPFSTRRRLQKYLGSACNVFIVKSR